MSCFDNVIVITGSIGSGKSYVSEKLRKLNFAVFDSDSSAKEIMNNDDEIKNNIIYIFGENSYTNGVLNKDVVSNSIFSNNDLLCKLESIVHPYVIKKFMDWRFEKLYKENMPFVFLENAIIVKNNIYKLFDNFIFVDTPAQIRFNRIMKRKGMTKKLSNIIMENQNNYNTYNKLIENNSSVFLINNDGKNDIDEILKSYIAFSV